MKNTPLCSKNIGHAEARGVVIADRNISSKLPMSSRQLISQLKSSKYGYTDETMLISLKRKWNGQFQLLFRTKFRRAEKGVSKHLVAIVLQKVS